MYIDVVPNRNSPPAVLLRESVRDGRRTLKRTLANLSALPEEAVAALRVVLRGGRLVEAGEHFAVTRSLPCGHVRAVKLAMQRLGMAELVGSKPSPERQAVLAMIAQRIVRPGSKLESAALFGETTLAEEFGVEGVDENALYAALDWLLERQPFIERKLAARHLREGAMVFYDVSSSSYHGSHCPLAKRGYNRDGLKLPGIVYGLLTDRDGRPVALRVYPGNTADPATVPDQIEAMRREFGVGRFVIVGDRGMLTGAQIDKLREIEGCGWISCLRSAEIRRLVEARDPSDAPLFTKGNLAEIEHPDFPGERLVVCHNELLAMDRERTRGELLDATEALLEKLRRRVARRTARPMGKGEIGVCVGRIINRHKMAKHFLVEIGEGSLAWSRKQEQIEREKALDGIYVVRTSEPVEAVSAADAVRTYKSLGNVEKAFRTFKGVDLRIRPIHHHLEDRVRAHMLLCMLAYYVEWHMRQALAPLLYAEEDLAKARAERDPVAKAAPTERCKRKKATRQTDEGLGLRRWDGLLNALSTQVRNTCQVAESKEKVSFTRDTQPNAFQSRAFDLLAADAPFWPEPVSSRRNGESKPKTSSSC
jgi:transposase